MKRPTHILTEFVLDRLADVPVRKRIKLTRALAAVEPSARRRAALTNIADQFEKTERAHKQLRLDFKREDAQ